MVIGSFKPFPSNISSQEIEKARQLDTLQPVRLRNALGIERSGYECWCSAWSPGGDYFAWSAGNRLVHLVPWNKYRNITESDEDSENQVVIDTGELVWSMAFAVATGRHRVNTTLGRPHYRYKISGGIVIATGLASGRIRIWDVRTGHLHLELLDHKDVVRDLKFCPNNETLLASVSRDGTIKFWDLADDGNMFMTLRADCNWFYACDWSPDGRLVCTVGNNKCAVLWDFDSHTAFHKLEGHNHDVVGCNFSPDGSLLATCSYDSSVLIWDSLDGTCLKQLSHLFPSPSYIISGGANGSFVRAVAFAPDCNHVASVCDDSFVRFWNINDVSAGPEMVSEVQNGLCCSFSPNGAVLAVGSRSGVVTFWLAPREVPSLQHSCRATLRSCLTSTRLRRLALPSKLLAYLLYEI